MLLLYNGRIHYILLVHGFQNWFSLLVEILSNVRLEDLPVWLLKKIYVELISLLWQSVQSVSLVLETLPRNYGTNTNIVSALVVQEWLQLMPSVYSQEHPSLQSQILRNVLLRSLQITHTMVGMMIDTGSGGRRRFEER